MLESLKEEVLRANLDLFKHDLVTFTWGNASGIDRKTDLVVIKPSGVDYDRMVIEDMIVVDLDGNLVEGNYKPSSDTATHLVLYRSYPTIGGIAHTHSTYATSWAQACKDIPAYGTTHADYFYGSIPCAGTLTKEAIVEDYERNTGRLIVETFTNRQLDVKAVPGIILSNHGPFSWGKDADDAVHNAVVMEEVAKMALFTKQINADVQDIPSELLEKHYYRKHGAGAYYGQ